jgi:hypothetical protein
MAEIGREGGHRRQTQRHEEASGATDESEGPSYQEAHHDHPSH